MSDFNDKFKNLNIQTAISAPERPGTSLPAPEEPETNNQKKERRSKRTPIIVGIAGAALAASAAGIFGYNAMNEKPNTDPVPTEPSEPSEEPDNNGSPEEEPGNAVELRFDQETQQLAETIVEDVLESWANAGADPSLIDRALEENKPWEILLPEIAHENALEYTKNYFVEDTSDPRTQETIQMFEQNNLSVLDWYSATAFNTENPENVEGYRIDMTVDGAAREISNENGVRVIQIDTIESSNDQLNSADPIANPNATLTITLVKNGDSADILSIDGVLR